MLSGRGRPISPAFSMIERPSFVINPMHTASLRYSVPINASRREAMRTYNNVMPFLHNPFQPALLSSAPFSDFGLFPNTAGRRIPPVNQSIAINKSNVCRNLSQPPKHTARVLPARPINVIILYFIVFHLFFLKNGYKKNGRWGNANRSLHNQLYSSLTLFLSNNHNITFVPVYRYLFAI